MIKSDWRQEALADCYSPVTLALWARDEDSQSDLLLALTALKKNII